VKINARTPKLADFVSRKSRVVTGKDGYLKLYIPVDKVVAIVGPNSEMVMEGTMQINSTSKTLFTMSKGMLRVVASKARGKEYPIVWIDGSLSYAVFQNGDVIYINNDSFLENEIIAMEGETMVSSKDDKHLESSIPLVRSQWAGVGGRFGAKISGPVMMTPKVMSHYNYFNPATEIKKSYADEDLYGQWVPVYKVNAL